MPILPFRRRPAGRGAQRLTPLPPTPRAVEQTRGVAAPVERRRPALAIITLTDIELLVAPFPSLRDAGRFHQTLTGLPSVRGVDLRRLRNGTAQLHVECSGPAVLLDELEQSWMEPFHVVAREPHRIELAIGAERDLFIPEGRRA